MSLDDDILRLIGEGRNTTGSLIYAIYGELPDWEYRNKMSVVSKKLMMLEKYGYVRHTKLEKHLNVWETT